MKSSSRQLSSVDVGRTRSTTGSRRVIVSLVIAVADVLAMLPIYLLVSISTIRFLHHGAQIAVVLILGLSVWLIGRRAWRQWPEASSTALYVIGLVTHFASVFVFVRISWLRPCLWIITVSGLLTVATLLLSQNDGVLKSLLPDSEYKRGIPRTMLRFNRLMTAGLIVSLFVLFVILSVFMGGYQQRTRYTQSAGSGQMPFHRLQLFGHHPPIKLAHLPKTAPPGPMSRVLAEVIIGAILLAAVLGVCWLLYTKILPRIWAWIQARSNFNEPFQGFVDEQEIIEHALTRRNRGLNLFHLGIASKADSPAEQVRLAYRRMIRRMRRLDEGWSETHTADKVIKDYLQDLHRNAQRAEPLRQIYDKARYSNGDVSADEAKLWTQTVEVQKKRP